MGCSVEAYSHSLGLKEGKEETHEASRSPGILAMKEVFIQKGDGQRSLTEAE